MDTLLDKYREMLRLRREHEDGIEVEPRAAMRRLAAAFPGALRELDAIPMDELRRRVEHLEAVTTGAVAEPWVAVSERYHQLLNVELRGRSTGTRGQTGMGLVDRVLARLARETGSSQRELREVLFRFGK